MENLSLFEQQDTSEVTTGAVKRGNSLDVTKVDFVEVETLSWQELFFLRR